MGKEGRKGEGEGCVMAVGGIDAPAFGQMNLCHV